MAEIDRFSKTPGFDEKIFLNIAAVCHRTNSLGPGTRAVVWVQGCSFHCPGCVAPDWIPFRPARLVSPEELADEMLADTEVTGLTFSGGEPMLQAGALARLAYLAKRKRDVNIICFSGFQRLALETTPPVPGVRDLLGLIDVLIDGPYISRLNDNRGLRGSYNQKIHYLTDRLSAINLESCPRSAEVLVQDGQALLVGVPPVGVETAFQQALDTAHQLQWEMLHYERT